MAGFRRIQKRLMCAHCDALIAEAKYRPAVSWQLDITSSEGYQLTPLSGSVELRIAEQQLADASPGEEDLARRRVGFIKRNLGEVLYDLPCPRGHRTLVTALQIARAMRRAGGEWVFLKDAG